MLQLGKTMNQQDPTKPVYMTHQVVTTALTQTTNQKGVQQNPLAKQQPQTIKPTGGITNPIASKSQTTTADY